MLFFKLFAHAESFFLFYFLNFFYAEKMYVLVTQAYFFNRLLINQC